MSSDHLRFAETWPSALSFAFPFLKHTGNPSASVDLELQSIGTYSEPVKEEQSLKALFVALLFFLVKCQALKCTSVN